MINPIRYRSLLSTMSRSRPSFRQIVAAFSTTSSTDDDSSFRQLRSSALRCSLPCVHEYGWTRDAVAQGVLSSRLPPSFAGSVTPEDLVSHFMRESNANLKRRLEVNIDDENDKEKNYDVANVSRRIRDAVRYRLEAIVPFLESGTWHEAMALGATRNPTATAAELDELVTIITDHAFSRTVVDPATRLATGAVYVATELHMLADKSPNREDTWEFLAKRADECARGKAVLPDSNAVQGAVAVASSVATALMSLAIPKGVADAAESALRTGAASVVSGGMVASSFVNCFDSGGAGSASTNATKDVPPLERHEMK